MKILKIIYWSGQAVPGGLCWNRGLALGLGATFSEGGQRGHTLSLTLMSVFLPSTLLPLHCSGLWRGRLVAAGGQSGVIYGLNWGGSIRGCLARTLRAECSSVYCFGLLVSPLAVDRIVCSIEADSALQACLYVAALSARKQNPHANFTFFKRQK